MATKPGKAVTYNEKLSFIKLHDPSITWSSEFDLSYKICRFRTQTSKSHTIDLFVAIKGNFPGLFFF